jgi:hypothetical protein
LGYSDDRVGDAWLAAVPTAIFHLLTKHADEALALFDRIIAWAGTDETLDAWQIAAWSAFASSRGDRPDVSARLTDRASEVFRQIPSNLLEDTEITAAWSGFPVNAITHYGAAQRWDDIAAARDTLDRVAARFPDTVRRQIF